MNISSLCSSWLDVAGFSQRGWSLVHPLAPLCTDPIQVSRGCTQLGISLLQLNITSLAHTVSVVLLTPALTALTAFGMTSDEALTPISFLRIPVAVPSLLWLSHADFYFKPNLLPGIRCCQRSHLAFQLPVSWASKVGQLLPGGTLQDPKAVGKPRG